MFTFSRLSQLSLTLSVGASLAGVAHADPYAFASDQITGLTLTTQTGTSITPSTATTSIADGALFGPSGPSGFQASGIVGNALTIPQAFAGPGAAPPASFTPAGPPGTFIGSRGDASIGAGSAASGGVAVNNVAEAFGPQLGNSSGTDNAAIQFTVTGTGEALKLTFSDLYQLAVSSDPVPQDSANAAIQNAFTVSVQGGSQIATYAPSQINQQIGSADGVPASLTVGPTTFVGSFTTPILSVGTNYVISLTSSASETIQPGTPVSEPAAAGLLAVALASLGLVRGRSANRRA